MDKLNAVEVGQHMANIGVMGDACGGVQIDIAVAYRQTPEGLVEGTTCDHDCTNNEGCGNYDCPAHYSAPGNRGLKITSMAPADVMLDRITNAVWGVRRAVERFLEVDYHGFCYTSEIRDEVVKGVIESRLRMGKVIVNVFGGEPLLYPHFLQLEGALMDRGYTLNVTTTGDKWLDPKFAKAMEDIEPTVLALSLDDLTIPELRRLSKLTPEQIKQEWKALRAKNPKHGQALKALEAVYVFAYYKERGGYPKGKKLLANAVVHKGNLSHIRDMFEVVAEVAPGIVFNPYAGQAAFDHDETTGLRRRGEFGADEVQQFSDFVDWSISESKRPDGVIVKRLPHWLLHRAALDVHEGKTREQSDAIAGWNSWRCHNHVGAGFFMQVGRSPKVRIPNQPQVISIQGLHGKTGSNGQVYPGGHLGCFWDPTTVTQDGQYHDQMEVMDYLHYGMKSLAQKSADPCPGCRMPRLDSLHLVILEAGIPTDDPTLKNRYLNLRREHAGF